MSVSLRFVLCLAGATVLPAVVHAETPAPLTPEQSVKVGAYMAQSSRIPGRIPARVPDATQAAINGGVMQAVNGVSPDQSRQMTAYLIHSDRMPAPAPSAATVALNEAVTQVIATPSQAPVVTVAAATHAAPNTPNGSDNDVATVSTPDKSMLAILDFGAPDARPGAITYGMSSGQGMAPPVPVGAEFTHSTALAVVAAFENPGHDTADAVATYAATPALDPALEERVGLVLAVYRLDGTEELIRKFVATTHMRLIIEEVARHIDFSKLSETDKYRLAAIAAVAQTELEEKILRMSAIMQAQNLTKPDLLQLIAAYDNDAQRKLTYRRLHDDGKVDRAAELDIRMAQFQIVKAFEAGQ